jgi:hypothetical protein
MRESECVEILHNRLPEQRLLSFLDLTVATGVSAVTEAA